MANEVELKLSLPIRSQSLFLRQAVLNRAVSRHTQSIVTVYHDTPELALHDRGMALRLRKQGHTWLQTVKCAGTSVVGLSSRPEWETAYRGQFDFSMIDVLPVRAWLERTCRRTSITPVFETRFNRITWRFEPSPGCAFLLVLDRGWIAAAGRREPISELEIELACAAHPDNIIELFDFARSLAKRISLLPVLRSKAERGYRLFLGNRDLPQKADSVPIRSSDEPAVAFRKILLGCLTHLQGNHAGALLNEDAEFIHQMRVSARRIRAAMRLFAPHLPDSFTAVLRPSLHDLMNRLGALRDLDVLRSDIVAPSRRWCPDETGFAKLAGVVDDRQRGAYRAAASYLRSAAYGQFLLRTMADLHRPPFVNMNDDEVGAVSEQMLLFVRARLNRLKKKTVRLAKCVCIDDPTSLHRLRIAIKRWRYAIEFVLPLIEPRPAQSLLHQLGCLQDDLGKLHDLANAGPLLMQCAGSHVRLHQAVAWVGAWHVRRYDTIRRRLPQQIEKLILSRSLRMR